MGERLSICAINFATLLPVRLLSFPIVRAYHRSSGKGTSPTVWGGVAVSKRKTAVTNQLSTVPLSLNLRKTLVHFAA